jgi:GNAT superfamily N-acetyltransferase
MAVLTRPFVPEDAEACGAIVAITPLWQRYKLTAAAAAAQLIAAHARGETVTVIESDSQVAGFAWVVPAGAFGMCPYLRRIVVAPDQRGLRLGAQLLRAVEEHSAKLATDLFLLVSDFNADAQRFYKREGYEEVGRLADFVLPGVAELIFRKRVRAVPT